MSDIFRKILVPMDFSECADEALAYAVRLARHHGASITLLHVVQVPDVYGPYEAWAFNRAAVERQILDESDKHLAEIRRDRVPADLEADVRSDAGVPEHRQILQRVYAEIHLAIEQCRVEFGGKEIGIIDLAERR